MDEISSDRDTLLNTAGLIECAAIAAALGLSWLFGLDIWHRTIGSGVAIVWGLLALLPMLLLFFLLWYSRRPGFQKIKDLLIELLGPALADSSWLDLILLSILVGIGEELLFRGAIFSVLALYSQGLAYVGTNLLFALCHAVTPWYTLFAGLAGLYLTLVTEFGSQGNLLCPIVAHATYDFICFAVVRQTYLKSLVAPSKPLPGEQC